jgi:hypothetical protein
VPRLQSRISTNLILACSLVSIFQNLYERERSFVSWEQSDIPHFLEGTGGLVLDRVNKIGYVALSQRANIQIAQHWAKKLGYTLVTFRATDANGHTIYHTNVMMSVSVQKIRGDISIVVLNVS